MPLETGSNSFQAIFDRLAKLEQMITSPDVIPGGDGAFDTVIIGPTNGTQVILNVTPPGAPTGISIVTGGFQENTFADVSWTAATAAFSYSVELQQKIAGIYQVAQIMQTIGTNVRFDALIPNADYGVRVAGMNRAGVVGPFSARVDFVTGADSTPPPVLTGLTAFRGAASVIATWDVSTAPDVSRGHGLYFIELSNDNFTTVLFSARTGAQVHVFEGILAQGAYYVRVSAIDSSGNQGIASPIVSAIAGGIIGNQILNDTIVAGHIAAGQITTGHMVVGSIDGDRFTANTIDVAKLLADSILAKNINIGAGGQFKVGTPPTGSGMVINSQGVSLYDNTGARTIYLNALDGSGSFTGTIYGSSITGSSIVGGTIVGTHIKTGTSGEHIELGQAGSLSFLYWKTADVAETESGYAWLAAGNPGAANRYYTLDIKAPTLVTTPAFGASPFVRLVCRSFDGTVLPYAQFGVNATSHLIISAAQSILRHNTDIFANLTDTEVVVRRTADSYIKAGATESFLGFSATSYLRLNSAESTLSFSSTSYCSVFAGGANLNAGTDLYISLNATNGIDYAAQASKTHRFSIGSYLMSSMGRNGDGTAQVYFSSLPADTTGAVLRFNAITGMVGVDASFSGGGSSGIGAILEYVYSQKGAVTVVSTGGRFQVRENRQIFEVVASLDTNGTSTTTVEIRANGTLVATLNLVSGSGLASGTLTTALVSGDYVTARVTAAGAGAKDLNIQIRTKRT